ncbi:TPR Domain containing protein [Trichomonas vaginalis G3]|uniref:TPR Domain containing protein n=1 Tax=Trichomonas vaginalis (strain ATCC PRA-98 / G3) TaxID=412133 RepID=A2DBH4_TRIV3|nr:TPR-like family [Trichomonas vaginalis G3]EAY22177.1 TPR Domain containing protein [Trichomonas vaginalis G3]KAI5533365.1 TPR-like family [Trichomonas vaginalis G3]|eukprot:XP_001583163.1 TPR Domain containing protein [Trichomonas vaginalis G3]
MLDKAQLFGATQLAEKAMLKLLPYFMILDQRIQQQCQFDIYYRKIMQFIRDNRKHDQEKEVLYNFGLAFLLLGDSFRGTSFILSAVKLGLDITANEKPYVLGYVYMYQKDYNKAIKCFSISINSRNSDIRFYSYFFRAMAYRYLKDFDSAINDLEYLKQIETMYITKYDISFQLLETIARKDQNKISLPSFYIFANLGGNKSIKELLYVKIKYMQAYDIESIINSLPLHEQLDRDISIMYIYSVIKSENYLVATSMIKELIEQNRMDHGLWYLLGYSYLKMSCFANAAICLQNAYVLNQTPSSYKLAFGLSLELTDRKEDASLLYSNRANEPGIISECDYRFVRLVTSGPETISLSTLVLVDIDELVQCPMDRQIDILLTSGISLPCKFIPYLNEEEPFNVAKASASLFPDYVKPKQ